MSRVRQFIDAWNQRRRAAIRRDGAPHGVLFVSSGGLGDTILLAHVMDRFCTLARPGEPIALVLRSDGAKTAFLLPRGIKIVTVDYRRLRRDGRYRRAVGDDLYRGNYRLAVSLDYLRHPFLDEYLMSAAAAADSAAMIARPWRKYQPVLDRHQRLFGKLFDSGPPVFDKVLRWHGFADWLTGTSAARTPARVDPAALPPPQSAPRPFVMVQAFSAIKAKQAAPALLAEVLASLPEDWDVVFAGAPGEDAANPAYADLMAGPRVRYDDRPFEALVPSLRAARLAISVDTAFMHLAIAVGTPTVALASAAYVGEIVPYAAEIAPPNAHFVYHDMPCRSCLGDCRLPPEGGRYPCIARLDPAEAVAAVRAALEAPR